MTWTECIAALAVFALLIWLFRQIGEMKSGRWLIESRFIVGGLWTGFGAADYLWRNWASPLHRVYGFIALPIIGLVVTYVSGQGFRPKEATPRNPEYLRLERRALQQFSVALIPGVVLGAPLLRGRWTDTVAVIKVFIGVVLYISPNILRRDEIDDDMPRGRRIQGLFWRWRAQTVGTGERS